MDTLTAFIHGGCYKDGKPEHSLWTKEVEIIRKPLWWQKQGLSYTATGYGSRIPTEYMVKFNGKWRRVYCRIYSNNGTMYIGTLKESGERLIVQTGYRVE